jgi:xylulokinase
MLYALGLDIGTSGCKAVALATDGHVLARAESPYRIQAPRPGWAEQHPDQWWRAAGLAVCSLAGQLPDIARAAVIGVTGQMHTLVPLDAHDSVIRPAILWSDQRSTQSAAWIARTAGEELVQSVTCNPSRAAYTASKLIWLRRHEPDAFARLRRAMLPKDWLVLRLTGVSVTDPSSASGTGLFDVVHGEFSEPLLARLELDPDLFPPVEPSAAIVGHLNASAAADLSLPGGIPVIAGGGDQAAAAHDAGVDEPGAIACSLGTSIAVMTSRPAPSPSSFAHVIPGQWLRLTSAHSGMVALDWWSRIIHPSGRSSPTEALRAAARSEAGARGVRFIPLLMGTADEPGRRPQFGAFQGLREEHAAEDLARAVIEGIAFEVRRIADPVNAADHWRVLGGGTRGALLIQTLADVLGVHMTVLPSGSSASGAARLALSALGHPPTWSPADAHDVTPGYAHDYGPAFAEFCLAVRHPATAKPRSTSQTTVIPRVPT